MERRPQQDRLSSVLPIDISQSIYVRLQHQVGIDIDNSVIDPLGYLQNEDEPQLSELLSSLNRKITQPNVDIDQLKTIQEHLHASLLLMSEQMSFSPDEARTGIHIGLVLNSANQRIIRLTVAQATSNFSRENFNY